MAMWKKTDAKTKAKILEKKINNPDLSTRDIAKDIWGINNTTVNDIINTHLPQLPTDSQAVAKLIDTNNNLQSLADNLLKEWIIAKDEKVTPWHLVSLRESTFKQNQLLTGKPTDIQDVKFKDLEWKPLSELLEYINNATR